MVTLRQAAQQALEALERADKISGHANNRKAITALRQAIGGDTKPCACCGEGNARISVTRVCDTCGSEYAGQAEMDLAKQVKRQPLTDEQIVSMANPTQYLPEAPEGWVRFGFSRKHLVGFARAVLDAAQQPPVVEQPQIDWHDMYLKEKRRAEMWVAKYEKDIGKLQVAVPVAARPPSVAARTCANCLHNSPPFGNCDGCSQQNDDADDEGNWEPIPEPQGEQEPVAWALYCADKLHLVGINRHPLDGYHSDWSFRPLYTRPHPRQPLTVEQIDGIIRDLDPSWLDTPTGFEEEFCRAIERAHGIK